MAKRPGFSGIIPELRYASRKWFSERVCSGFQRTEKFPFFLIILFCNLWLLLSVLPFISIWFDSNFYTTTVIKFWDWRLENRHLQEPGCRWKHRWNMLAGRSRTASLVAVMTSPAEWNLRPRRGAFIRGTRQKSHGARSGVVRRMWKNGDPLPCKHNLCLQVSLGQGQSDVQGRCHVAIANSSYTKAQDAYDQGFSYSGFCIQLHLMRWILCEQGHVAVFSVVVILAFSRWWISLQLRIVQQTTFSL